MILSDPLMINLLRNKKEIQRSLDSQYLKSHFLLPILSIPNLMIVMFWEMSLFQLVNPIPTTTSFLKIYLEIFKQKILLKYLVRILQLKMCKSNKIFQSNIIQKAFQINQVIRIFLLLIMQQIYKISTNFKIHLIGENMKKILLKEIKRRRMKRRRMKRRNKMKNFLFPKDTILRQETFNTSNKMNKLNLSLIHRLFLSHFSASQISNTKYLRKNFKSSNH